MDDRGWLPRVLQLASPCAPRVRTRVETWPPPGPGLPSPRDRRAASRPQADTRCRRRERTPDATHRRRPGRGSSRRVNSGAPRGLADRATPGYRSRGRSWRRTLGHRSSTRRAIGLLSELEQDPCPVATPGIAAFAPGDAPRCVAVAAGVLRQLPGIRLRVGVDRELARRGVAQHTAPEKHHRQNGERGTHALQFAAIAAPGYCGVRRGAPASVDRTGRRLPVARTR